MDYTEEANKQQAIEEQQQEYWNALVYRMKEEGFDYCFDGYSEWAEINDEKFQKLRLKYLEAKKELKDYINEK